MRRIGRERPRRDTPPTGGGLRCASTWGPFADRSGGLIIFNADSGEQAEQLVAGDPFIREDLLDRHWVKEWVVDVRAPATEGTP